MGPQTFVNKDLTPINSIVLVPQHYCQAEVS